MSTTTTDAPLVMDYEREARNARREANRCYAKARKLAKNAAAHRETAARWAAAAERYVTLGPDATFSDRRTYEGRIAEAERKAEFWAASADKADELVPRYRELARSSNARARRYDRLHAERQAQWAALDAAEMAEATEIAMWDAVAVAEAATDRPLDHGAEIQYTAAIQPTTEWLDPNWIVEDDDPRSDDAPALYLALAR